MGGGNKRKRGSSSNFQARKQNIGSYVYDDDEIICIGVKNAVICISSDEEDNVNTSTVSSRNMIPPKQNRCSVNVKSVIKSDIQGDNGFLHTNPIVIDLSDSEGDIIMQITDGQEVDDEGYEELYDGYQVGWNTDPRLSIEPDSLYEVDVLQTTISQLRLDSLSGDINGHQQHPRMLHPCHPWKGIDSNQQRVNFSYRWKNSILDHILPRSVPPRNGLYSPTSLRTGLLFHGKFHDLIYLQHIRQIDWTIMADACSSISQAGRKILFASSTPGGQSDNGEDIAISRENDSKTLALWVMPTTDDPSDTGWTWLKDHHGPSTGGRCKYYDITCARFDPLNSNLYISTGLDGYLAINRLISPSAKDGFSRFRTLARWKTSTLPDMYCRDIVFKPCTTEHTTFAAPCSDGQVPLCTYKPSLGHEYMLNSTHSTLRIPNNRKQRPGATVWGVASTSNQLFVCGEGPSDGSYEVYHYSFDVGTGQRLYSFDDTRSGEELVISPTGDTVALFTTKDDRLYASLYDVRLRDRHCIVNIQLPSLTRLHGNLSPEVRSAVWSSDEIMLAVGTNDDMVHIYDTRHLSAPILALQYKAETTEVPTNEYGYGITVLEWSTTTSFRTPRPGIFVGGNQKTLVFWDVKTACKEPRVIAKLENPISVGHFGDLSKGERPLILGDIAGRVFVYDFGFVS